MKKARVVEIDDRLTNLFISRKIEGVKDSRDETEIPESSSTDPSWLKEFQTQTSTSSQIDFVPSEGSSLIQVNLSEVRPFWSLEDRKSMISLWKQSKVWLAKDCQKQRKAALRKTSSK